MSLYLSMSIFCSVVGMKCYKPIVNTDIIIISKHKMMTEKYMMGL